MKTPICGHSDCGASSGICGAMTFGRGALDHYGYWEIPCYECARAYEKSISDQKLEAESAWPFPIRVKLDPANPDNEGGDFERDYKVIKYNKDYYYLNDSIFFSLSDGKEKGWRKDRFIIVSDEEIREFELKPCPFCNSEVTLDAWKEEDGATRADVDCLNCGMSFAFGVYGRGLNLDFIKKDVMERFNKRHV